MLIRTWPSTTRGAPFAWKATKSSGEPAGRIGRPAQTMLEELAQQLLRSRTVRPGGMRSADASRRKDTLHAVGGVVVEFSELFRRAAPVADVGLVPHFPVPALDLRL